MEPQLGESEQVGTNPCGASFTGGPNNLRLGYILYPPASPCPRPSGLRHDHDGSGDRLRECTPAKITVCRSTALHRLSLPRVSTAGTAIGLNRLLLLQGRRFNLEKLGARLPLVLLMGLLQTRVPACAVFEPVLQIALLPGERLAP